MLYLFGGLAAGIASGVQAGTGAAGAHGQLEGRINDLSDQMDATKVQFNRERRDLKREGEQFMARARHFVARSGAAGTASEFAITSSPARENALSVERLEQDKDLRVASLRARRETLKNYRTFNLFNSATGIFGGVLANQTPPGDKPVTDIPTFNSSKYRSTAYSRSYLRGAELRTSKPGGQGGF